MGAFNFNRSKRKLFGFFWLSGFLFLLYPVFYEYQLVAFRIQNNFFPPEKLNSPSEKELQDVISRLKVFFSDETDRIPSHILTSTFMSHSVSVYLLYHTCFCAFLFCTRVS